MLTTPALAAILCQALAAGQGAPATYQSDFARGPSGFYRVFHYYGHVQIAVDANRSGPSGAPSLRATFTGKTKTVVGARLKIRPKQRLRVELAGAARLENCDRIHVVLKCVAADGKQRAWLSLGAFPRGHDFERLRSPVVEIPDGTARAYLFVFVQDAVGSVWIADVSVRSVDVPKELEAKFAAIGPTSWGINDPFALAYQTPHDATLSDTCAKFMAAAGFDRARVWCWWGSRDQLKNDINKGGAWVFVDKRGGDYDFSELEQRLDRIEAYGMKPAPVIIHGTPVWASGKTGADVPAEIMKNWRVRRRPFFPPNDWADLERFVHALVSRFKGRVRTWEVMNEPNTPDSGLQGGYRVYMDYLRHFYRAAKEADRDCVVLCSRVGLEWFDLMLRRDPSIADSFDALVSHPYTDGPAGSLAIVRALQLRMAEAGFVKPIHITEFSFFGGKWKDDAAADVLQRQMADRIRAGAPLMATVSDEVTWWNAVFKTNRHGLLRNDAACLTPLRQYWAFAETIGRLKREWGDVTAHVTLPRMPLAVGQQAVVELVARNTSREPRRVRLWPVGFVTALGCAATTIPAHEWRGLLEPGERRAIEMRVEPTPQAGGYTFTVGLAVISEHGNTLTTGDLAVSAAL